MIFFSFFRENRVLVLLYKYIWLFLTVFSFWRTIEKGKKKVFNCMRVTKKAAQLCWKYKAGLLEQARFFEWGCVQKPLQVGTSLLSLRWCWQMSCLFNAPFPPPAQVPFPPATPLCVYIIYCFSTDVLFTITGWNGSALSHPTIRRESSGEMQAVHNLSGQTAR